MTAMRMPDQVTINPSRPYYWYGDPAWARGETRFSYGQRAAMEKAGLDPATVEAIVVRRQAGHEEMWWPTTQDRPVFEFECPVLARLRDGRVRIISPSGEQKIVLGDGWIRAPKKRKWS